MPFVQVYENKVAAEFDLIPNLDMPTDHYPVVVDFFYA